MSAKNSKTLKLVWKRLKITRGGKVLRRTAGQGHNKSKMPGALTRSRRKRRETGEHPIIRRAIKKMIQVR